LSQKNGGSFALVANVVVTGIAEHLSMAINNPQFGEIDANSLYTLSEISRRLGLGKAALRTARRQGLVVRRIGRRSYILGADLIAWFKQAARTVE
jgi:Helix-turn-helix domain